MGNSMSRRRNSIAYFTKIENYTSTTHSKFASPLDYTILFVQNSKFLLSSKAFGRSGALLTGFFTKIYLLVEMVGIEIFTLSRDGRIQDRCIVEIPCFQASRSRNNIFL